MQKRGSGILLHISSLPSPYGIGDFGPGAYKFVDFLLESGQSYWQILPLNPIAGIHGNSPYSSFSAYAGNCLFISPDLLAENGFISKSDIESPPRFVSDMVLYKAAVKYKSKLLRLAYERCRERIKTDCEFEGFCRENSDWLEDYALFVALKDSFNGSAWTSWPEGLKYRRENALSEWKGKLADRINMEKFFQYIFFNQWDLLKQHCNRKGIQIIGDMPIYVNHDSTQVWTHPEVFKLNEKREPVFVAGVPPDYFSSTGQLWGNPVYDWDVLKGNRYAWWAERLEKGFKLYDIIRLDHFRGFVAYWEVGAGEKTAMKGKWVNAPAVDFFESLYKRFACLPVIAEDLGYITADVREVIDHFGMPTMKVLLFAFGDGMATNPYAPHNHVKNSIVYTGTHDNNTVRGWFESEANAEDKKRIWDYVGREISADDIHWEFVRMAMMSVADTAVIPMQDVLGLGEKARMNLPGTIKRNWAWRLESHQIRPSVTERLAHMTNIYGRG
ncbi:MAG: 4-alpha-glucanotransferase [Pseudomonadota bacterium]